MTQEILSATDTYDLTHFNFCTACFVQGFWSVYYIIQTHHMMYHLLSSHQSGFRAGYSTQDVLLHVTDKWLRAVDEGKCTGVVLPKPLILWITQFCVLN